MHMFSFQLWNDVFIRCVCACVAGLWWVWQKELLTASAPSQSVGILSRRFSLQCPHSSFSACFLELVPTPCPRTVAATIVSLPGSSLALLQHVFTAPDLEKTPLCSQLTSGITWHMSQNLNLLLLILSIYPNLCVCSPHQSLPIKNEWSPAPHQGLAWTSPSCNTAHPSSYGSQLPCLPCPSPALSSHNDHLQKSIMSHCHSPGNPPSFSLKFFDLFICSFATLSPWDSAIQRACHPAGPSSWMKKQLQCRSGEWSLNRLLALAIRDAKLFREPRLCCPTIRNCDYHHKLQGHLVCELRFLFRCSWMQSWVLTKKHGGGGYILFS